MKPGEGIGGLALGLLALIAAVGVAVALTVGGSDKIHAPAASAVQPAGTITGPPSLTPSITPGGPAPSVAPTGPSTTPSVPATTPSVPKTTPTPPTAPTTTTPAGKNKGGG
jgi:hypothetical protein